jgi:hypothetical protein
MTVGTPISTKFFLIFFLIGNFFDKYGLSDKKISACVGTPMDADVTSGLYSASK